METAAYTARYVVKKVLGDQKENHYQRSCQYTGDLINLEPEYMTCSLKPGIGAKWYEKYKTDCFPSDYLIYKGKKIQVPRYYEKLFEAEGGEMEEIKMERKRKAAKHFKNNTPERLTVREKIKQLNYEKLTRSIET